MSATASPLITTEEMLALPENGMDRMLIRGQLIERPMSYRNRPHSRSTGHIGGHLYIWWLRQPEPRGELLVGDAAFLLRRNPDTAVGMDLAYISADLAASVPHDVRFIEGVPLLAVEILSPWNRWEDVTDKLRDYLAVGIPLVWVLDPVVRTVQVYRPGAEPVMLNSLDEFSGDPHLPGFRVPVAKLFTA